MKVTLRYRKLRSNRIAILLDIYRAKRNRQRESLGILIEPDDSKEIIEEKKAIAENIRAKRMLELANEEFGLPSAAKRKQNFIDYFHAQLSKREPKNKENWLSVYKLLVKYKGSSVTFNDVDESWLEGFKNFLLKKGLCINSTITYMTKVRACLNRAVKDRIIPFNPAHNLDTIQKEETEKVYLTVDELQKIANTDWHNKVKEAFLFSCYTGLRVSDIKALKWHQVQKERLENKDVYMLKFTQKKTKGINYLPLNNTALALIGTPKNDDEYVFHLPMHNRSISRSLKSLTKKAGIERHIWFHCGRHTHAVLLLANGTDLFTVSKLLGHRDIKSTTVYAKVIDDTKMKAVNNLPSLYNNL